MSSLSALSVIALGPKAATKPSASEAKVTMPRCVANGSLFTYFETKTDSALFEPAAL
jgi:hypothetical protein